MFFNSFSWKHALLGITYNYSRLHARVTWFSQIMLPARYVMQNWSLINVYTNHFSILRTTRPHQPLKEVGGPWSVTNSISHIEPAAWSEKIKSPYPTYIGNTKKIRGQNSDVMIFPWYFLNKIKRLSSLDWPLLPTLVTHKRSEFKRHDFQI